MVSVIVAMVLIYPNSLALHSSTHLGHGINESLHGSLHAGKLFPVRIGLLFEGMGANLQGSQAVIIGG